MPKQYPTLEAAIAAAEQQTGGRKAGRWVYQNKDGRDYLWVVRFNLTTPQGAEKPEKAFRPFHYNGAGWVMGDPPGPLPLYRLAALSAAGRVYAVEGEKAAEAAVAIGLNATTSAHGSQAPGKTDWSPLAGKEVIALPDADAAGAKYVQAVVRGVEFFGTTVRVVKLPGLPPKGDIVEFIEARTAAGLTPEQIRGEIEALADAAPKASVGSGGDPGEVDHEFWPEPRPLPALLPPVLPFDPDLLPESLRGWLTDIAERIQCPLDFPAVSAMVGLASVVGRKIGIRPKRHDDWLVVPNLWGGVIGRPGVMKTPAILEPLRPLKRLEIKAKQEFDAKVKDREAEERVGEIENKETGKQIRDALSKKNKADALRMARESLDEDEDEPVRKRYLVNDSTVEKLGVILNQNPFGVLVYRDELIGLLKSLDKEGQEGARSFYLEAWNGTGRYTYDRIARGTIDIEAAIVSIVGGIQPGPLFSYLIAAAKEGMGDDGLIQRFQLMVWPDISKDWVNVDRWPDSAARDKAFAVYEGLNGFDPVLVGADYDAHEPDGIPFLHFANDAQDLFNEWRAGLELKIRSGDEHPAVESHLAKFRSLIPSLALLIHLADGGSGPVGIGPLKKAIGWGVYLESHGRRIYSPTVRGNIAAARALAKKILSGDVKDRFALRDVYRKGWSWLATAEDAVGAADLLIELGWLVEYYEPTPGRTGTRFRINPRFFDPGALKNLDSPSGGTDTGDTRDDDGASGGSVGPEKEGPPDSAPPGEDWREVP